MTGTIFDIKEMAVHDGPGIRTTVFLKGCPLRCKWCHNPEGLSSEPQLMVRESQCLHCGRCKIPCNHEECQPFGRCVHACPEGLSSISGRKLTAKQLAHECRNSATILDKNFGGITFSGGEPLDQWRFLLDVARELNGIHLCIETSGYAKPEIFAKILSALDFIIMDIKLADTNKHKIYTGVGNARILENFAQLKSSGKPYIIRTPLIPGITDTKENLDSIKNIIGNSRWEQLPYNEMAGAKYKMLGMRYHLDDE